MGIMGREGIPGENMLGIPGIKTDVYRPSLVMFRSAPLNGTVTVSSPANSVKEQKRTKGKSVFNATTLLNFWITQLRKEKITYIYKASALQIT